MKGYYIIPTEGDPVEITGRGAKQKAIKQAAELYAKGDKEIYIIRFDDGNPDGFCAGENAIFIKKLLKGE